MFARENESIYDPDSSVILERPLANARVLNNQTSNTVWNQPSTLGANTSPSKHRRTDSNANIPIYSPSKVYAGKSPIAKAMESPQKSSLLCAGRHVTASASAGDTSAWSEDDVTINGTRDGTPGRNAKTVSFDVGPPQVNEYEMITPDPSSIASESREGSYDSDLFDMDAGFERGSSEEQEDSFDNSLEDADKTPVVLPEDWRFMSPDTANTELADTFEDPFETNGAVLRTSPNKKGSPTPKTMLARSESVNSEGERRPLPPLPMSSLSTANDESVDMANESIRSDPVTSRHHSVPRPASVSKAEILGMQGTSMPLEERLRRLAVQEQSKETPEQDAAPVAEVDHESTVTIAAPNEQEDLRDLQTEPTSSGSDAARAPPRISRESILRSVKTQTFDNVEGESPVASPAHEHFDPRFVDLDPDEPLPSREPSSNYDEDKPVDSSKPCNNRTKEIADMYSLPALQVPPSRSVSRADEFGRESSVIHHAIPIFEDEEARFEEDLSHRDKPTSDQKASIQTQDISYDSAAALQQEADAAEDCSISLPDFSAFSTVSDFGLGLQSYMSPSPPDHSPVSPQSVIRETLSDSAKSQASPRPLTPLGPPAPTFSHAIFEEVSTPDSVIHHPVSDDAPMPERDDAPMEEPQLAVVPDPIATIKASGGKLKTRRSNTTAELEAINNANRFTSDEMPPPIPSEFLVGKAAENQSKSVEEVPEAVSNEGDFVHGQNFGMKLDVPLHGSNDGLGLGLDQEFDRLLDAQKVGHSPHYATFMAHACSATIIESQHDVNTTLVKMVFADLLPVQRGYLMRQNTKMVVATNRNVSDEKKEHENAALEKPLPTPRETRSAGNSPRKASNPTVTTEPWNGRMRRHSTRRSIIAPERGITGNAAANESIDQSLVISPEDMSVLEDPESGVERGRFFVKVVGVKDLNLPLPRRK